MALMKEVEISSSSSKLRMATGDGENSYATNSRIQEKAILENRAALLEAVEEICTSLSAGSTMVVADLGCSSGPNTLLLVSEVVAAVRAAYHRKKETSVDVDEDEQWRAVEVQFFLNDLPGNDFNLVFRSLGKLKTPPTPRCYVAGLPGSFYERLFPSESVHFFHSSYCLHWRSKVPDGLLSDDEDYLNKDNIYIGKSTPPKVIQMFKEQFEKDFKLFLTLRFQELISGGRMLLTFLGRKSDDMLAHGEQGALCELLAKSLQSLVLKGLIEEDKLNSFNLPFYSPSMDEVETLINNTRLFSIEHSRVFKSNWDPTNDSENDGVALFDCTVVGINVAKTIRAVTESLIVDHFGEDVLDDLFMEFSSAVAKHVKKASAKYSVITVSLKKAHTHTLCC